jgi:AcrR family transcriptional regulator
VAGVGVGGVAWADLPGDGLSAGDLPAGDLPGSAGDEERGYAVGRARRDEIVDEAMKLFAAGGFRKTSLAEIAEAAGISKATLLHHFGSKDNLLIAVLRRRDERAPAGLPSPDVAPLDLASGLTEGARRNAREPGLVELYSVLAAESASPAHPGHAFFRERFRVGRAYFTAMFAALAADGRLQPGADPAFEATWLLALWDGLQLQWLYDPSAVDVADQLGRHLDDLITG